MSEAKEETVAVPGFLRVHGRKRGHLKPHQLAWLEETLPRYLLPPFSHKEELLRGMGLDEQVPLALEIGFGNGIFLAEMAARYPRFGWIGVELFQEGVAALLKRLEQEEIRNVRIGREAVQLFLAGRLPDATLDRVIINFPDPWPKVRHHKRRLIQTEFLDLLAAKMAPGALLTLATDWADYATWMLERLDLHPAFDNLAGEGNYSPQPEEWVITRFQQKGLDAGRLIWHLAFRKLA